MPCFQFKTISNTPLHTFVYLCMGHKHYHEPFGGIRGVPFTDKERQTLWLYVRDATIPQIAEKLGQTESTIETHLKHIRYKTGSGNIAVAYLKAQRLHWI